MLGLGVGGLPQVMAQGMSARCSCDRAAHKPCNGRAAKPARTTSRPNGLLALCDPMQEVRVVGLMLESVHVLVPHLYRLRRLCGGCLGFHSRVSQTGVAEAMREKAYTEVK